MWHHAGTLISAAHCFAADPVFHIPGHFKEVRIQYVVAYTEAEFSDTAAEIAEEGTSPDKMVTDVVGFNPFPAAFEALRAPTPQCKVVLDPRLGD